MTFLDFRNSCKAPRFIKKKIEDHTEIRPDKWLLFLSTPTLGRCHRLLLINKKLGDILTGTTSRTIKSYTKNT